MTPIEEIKALIEWCETKRPAGFIGVCTRSRLPALKSLVERCERMGKTEKMEAQMYNYIKASKQVESFNKWRAAGFPEAWDLAALQEVGDDL